MILCSVVSAYAVSYGTMYRGGGSSLGASSCSMSSSVGVTPASAISSHNTILSSFSHTSGAEGRQTLASRSYATKGSSSYSSPLSASPSIYGNTAGVVASSGRMVAGKEINGRGSVASPARLATLYRVSAFDVVSPGDDDDDDDDDVVDPNPDDKGIAQIEPIGDAVLPLMLLAMAYLLLAFRKRKRTASAC